MSPVQEPGEVFAVQRVGEYLLFTVVAPGVAAAFRPGQFVAVAVGGPRSAMLLRRSFALYDATASTDFAGTIDFVMAVRGPGTEWLADRQPGDRLHLVGPLGTPFPVPTHPVPAVLVGGGYGTAPLVPLARALLDAGCPVEFVIGAGTVSRLFGELPAKRLAGSVTVTTDDGSAGQQGIVTDVLPDVVVRSGAQVIYACGPMPMLRAVADVARGCAMPALVAVEEAMACGIGVCMTCVLPVRGGDGGSRFVRSCVEGPVFYADRVRWADVGRLPDDLVGAEVMRGH